MLFDQLTGLPRRICPDPGGNAGKSYAVVLFDGNINECVLITGLPGWFFLTGVNESDSHNDYFSLRKKKHKALLITAIILL
jgi:hypothetical protein